MPRALLSIVTACDLRAVLWHFRGLDLPMNQRYFELTAEPSNHSPSRVRRGGGIMKMMHLCYAALGLAVARWIFKRQTMPISRSGLSFSYLWPAVSFSVD